MIQELLGSGGGGGGGSSSAPTGKTSIGFSTQPMFTASSNAPSTTKENNISATTVQQNLRCPRCDSTNTKFCYYNNYNLTQPRHFCKTCRRYWTKGGTLRNVPIGGGCRKNKTSSHVPAGGTSSAATSGLLLKPSSNIANYKAKPTLSTEMLLNGNSGFLGNMDPYSDLQNPPIWPSIQQGQSSHILTLLRGQFSNPNPANPNPNPSHVNFTPLKTEGNNTTLGLDPYGNGAPSILGSFLRGNQQQSLNGYGLGGQDNSNNNSNILDLYQRLKSSGNYNYCGNDQNHGSMIFSNNNVIGSSSSSPSPSASAMNFEGSNGGGDINLGGYGMMNSSMGISGWSDFPTIPINGAFP